MVADGPRIRQDDHAHCTRSGHKISESLIWHSATPKNPEEERGLQPGAEDNEGDNKQRDGCSLVIVKAEGEN